MGSTLAATKRYRRYCPAMSYPSDREDPTTRTLSSAMPPASMSHFERSFDPGWVDEPDEPQGTAVLDATGDKTTMPSWD